MERIRTIRQVDKHHNFTLVCADLSQLAQYARVSNSDFRLLKAHTPGPYTFILEATPRGAAAAATREAQDHRAAGARSPVVRALLADLGEPIASSTLILPGETLPMSDPQEIRARLERQLDLVIDAGPCGMEPTTVVVLEDGVAEVARLGRGDPAPFQA